MMMFRTVLLAAVCVKTKFYGAFVMDRRDACSMAWWWSFLTARRIQDGRAIAEK